MLIKQYEVQIHAVGDELPSYGKGLCMQIDCEIMTFRASGIYLTDIIKKVI